MGKIILRLDRVMADRKMSLNELSERVGVSNVNLSKIKTGKISALRFSTLEVTPFTASRETFSNMIRTQSPTISISKNTEMAEPSF